DADVSTGRSETGLRDLGAYVRQTVPPSIAPMHEAPWLYRPFYRGYDVNLELRNHSIAALYKAAGSDLELFLHDAHDSTFRDGDGNRISYARWRKADALPLHRVDERPLELLDRATCVTAKVDRDKIVRDDVLEIAAPDRPLLAPNTLYEARIERRAPEPPIAAPPPPAPAEELNRDPVVFRFPFVTSRYTTFFHQIAESGGQVWKQEIETGLLTSSLGSAPGSDDERNPLSEAESRACDAVARAAVGTAAVRERPSRFEVSGLRTAASARAILLRSPEPMDLERIEITVEQTPWTIDLAPSTAEVSLVQVELNRTDPNDEIVDLLVREPMSLDGFRIERWQLPEALPELPGALFADRFDADAAPEPWTVIGLPAEWKRADRGMRLDTPVASPDVPAEPWKRTGSMTVVRDSS